MGVRWFVSKYQSSTALMLLQKYCNDKGVFISLMELRRGTVCRVIVFPACKNGEGWVKAADVLRKVVNGRVYFQTIKEESGAIRDSNYTPNDTMKSQSHSHLENQIGWGRINLESKGSFAEVLRKQSMVNVYEKQKTTRVKEGLDGVFEWDKVFVCTRERLWHKWSSIEDALNRRFKMGFSLIPFQPDKAIIQCKTEKEIEALGKQGNLFFEGRAICLRKWEQKGECRCTIRLKVLSKLDLTNKGISRKTAELGAFGRCTVIIACEEQGRVHRVVVSDKDGGNVTARAALEERVSRASSGKGKELLCLVEREGADRDNIIAGPSKLVSSGFGMALGEGNIGDEEKVKRGMVERIKGYEHVAISNFVQPMVFSNSGDGVGTDELEDDRLKGNEVQEDETVSGYEGEKFQSIGRNAKGWSRMRKNNFIKMKWTPKKSSQFHSRRNKERKKVALSFGKEREIINEDEVLRRWKSSFQVKADGFGDDSSFGGDKLELSECDIINLLAEEAESDSDESFEDCSSVAERLSAHLEDENWLVSLFNGGELESNSGLNGGGWRELSTKKEWKMWMLQGEGADYTGSSLSYLFGNDYNAIFSIRSGGLEIGNLGNKLVVSVLYFEKLVNVYNTGNEVTIRVGTGVEDGSSYVQGQKGEGEGIGVVVGEGNNNGGGDLYNGLHFGASKGQFLKKGIRLGVSLKESTNCDEIMGKEEWVGLSGTERDKFGKLLEEMEICMISTGGYGGKGME
ncbi:hypothetical protein LguiA_002593 [Lonicera macranthoides]